MKKITFKLSYDGATALTTFLRSKIYQPERADTLANLMVIHTIESVQYIERFLFFKFQKEKKFTISIAQAYCLREILSKANSKHPFEIATFAPIVGIIDQQL